MRSTGLMMCTLVVALSGAAFGDSVPNLINYQGKLVDSAGQPLPTGNYTLTFRIYDLAQGGNLVWGPQYFDGQAGTGHGPQLPAVEGHFNAMLGPVDVSSRAIIDAFGTSERYLEIQVAANPPLAPRQKLLSAPYALRTGMASQADVANRVVGQINRSPRVELGWSLDNHGHTNWVAAGPPTVITTNGRPVMVSMQSHNVEMGYGPLIMVYGRAIFQLRRDGQVISTWEYYASNQNDHWAGYPPFMSYVDDPLPAGTYSYSLHVRTADLIGVCRLDYGGVGLFAIEL